ncbi:MAG: hypothetical protein QMD80_02310 [archaeon]|nr:hypothetical protein [archaeon]
MMPLTSLVWLQDDVLKIGGKDVRVVYLAELDRIDEARKRLLESYTSKWLRYGENWLEKYLDFHMSVYLRAGFETKEECIDWLKDNAIPNTI